MPRKKKGQVPHNRNELNDSPPRKPATRKKASVMKKEKVPKTRNAGKWSEAEFWQMIRSALRNRSRFWVPRLKCLEAARRPSQSSNRRLKWEFKCSQCGEWNPQTQVEAHHSEQAGSLKSGADLEMFVEKLFAEDGWLCVCKTCHKLLHSK